MKYQPKAGTPTNDDVMTPPDLALLIVRHFRPSGYVLEPCSGDGAFTRAFDGFAAAIAAGDIKSGSNFLKDWGERVDWIVTNPPWSKIGSKNGKPGFLETAFAYADNVVFLITVNHVWTKSRIRLAREAGFGIREILLVDTPAEPWPASGFQVGAVHWQRGYVGPVTITDAMKGEAQ